MPSRQLRPCSAAIVSRQSFNGTEAVNSSNLGGRIVRSAVARITAHLDRTRRRPRAFCPERASPPACGRDVAPGTMAVPWRTEDRSRRVAWVGASAPSRWRSARGRRATASKREVVEPRSPTGPGPQGGTVSGQLLGYSLSFDDGLLVREPISLSGSASQTHHGRNLSWFF